MRLYMFRKLPLSIIRSFSLYAQQHSNGICHTGFQTACERDPARKLSANLYDIYHFCAYSEKLLMMERGSFRNM